MSKAVAVEGDTTEVTSTAKLPADTAQTGSWVANPLQVTIGEAISVGGKKVELGAEMSWSYVNGSAVTATGNIPIPPVVDTAKLVAKPTKLKNFGQNILVDGDEVSGKTDAANKIVVAVSQAILTTQ